MENALKQQVKEMQATIAEMQAKIAKMQAKTIKAGSFRTFCCTVLKTATFERGIMAFLRLKTITAYG